MLYNDWQRRATSLKLTGTGRQTDRRTGAQARVLRQDDALIKKINQLTRMWRIDIICCDNKTLLMRLHISGELR